MRTAKNASFFFIPTSIAILSKRIKKVIYMSDRHLIHWPPKHQHSLTLPDTSLLYNLEVSATRYPNKPYILYYDTALTFANFKKETEQIAAYLEHECHVKKGDRVLLYMQNSPQFMISYYGIMRANAVVVPINPMNVSQELEHYITDTDARVIITSQELFPQVSPHLDQNKSVHLEQAIVACYNTYIRSQTDLQLPQVVQEKEHYQAHPNAIRWDDVLVKNLEPGPILVQADDLCVMPYTSGTTGNPKGCMHTHRTVMATILASESWFDAKTDHSRLSVLPMFHVTGMQSGLNSPMYSGSTVILLTRWDRDVAARCIEKYKIDSFSAIPTMVVDFLANPNLSNYDISSIRRLNGGGTAMPEAIAQKLLDMGLPFIEGYGLSETIAPSHLNPVHRPKKQCLGIPIFGVDSKIIDPLHLTEMPQGEVGEIIIHGPQVFKGYWKNEEATKNSFIELDGKSYFRTGDLAKEDEDGYFFMVDRLKRMINASGYKVWPAEVELMLYKHPAIQEACIISSKDPYRGETVKALVVLKQDAIGKISEEEIITWANQQMAVYKAPKKVEFLTVLPKSGSGKILWRQLQDEDAKKTT